MSKNRNLYLTSLTRNNKQPQRLESLLSHAILSEEVVNITDQELGKGNFGVVKYGFFKKINVNCAQKSKNITKQNLFNVVREARVLEFLQGCKFFPYVLRIIKKTSLFMEILCSGNDCKVLTVYRGKTEKITFFKSS